MPSQIDIVKKIFFLVILNIAVHGNSFGADGNSCLSQIESPTPTAHAKSWGRSLSQSSKCGV